MPRRLLPPLLYAFIALALTWPLAMDLGGQVVGGMRSDSWNSVWSLWFVHESLVGGRLPLETALLDHPMGGRLVVADPLNAALGYPLVIAFGPVIAYGLLALGHSLFAGLAAHHLGRTAGGSGWVAGVGYQLAPIVVSHFHNGSSEAMSAGWLPLAALALLRLVQEPSIRRAVLAGMALAACAVAGWYGGVGAWCVVVALAMFNPHRLGMLALAGAVALGFTLPVAGAVRSVAQAPDGLVHIKNDGDLARLRRTIGPADPRTFFVPGDFRSPDFNALEGRPGDYVHTTYLGYTLLGLGLLGLVRRREEDGAGPWVLAGVTGAVLAMGPVVVMNGFPVSLAGRAIPLPYLVLERFGGFSTLSLLYRIAGVTALAAAVLADRGAPRRFAPFAAALVALEVLFISPVRGLPAVTPLPESTALEVLAEAPDGAVVNLPVTAARSYLYEQTVHRKPLAASLNTGANRASLSVLSAARKVKEGQMSPQDVADVATGQRVRYVVVHKGLLISETFVKSAGAIRREFELLAEDEAMRVYKLY